jgi:hypothetical protein
MGRSNVIKRKLILIFIVLFILLVYCTVSSVPQKISNSQSSNLQSGSQLPISISEEEIDRAIFVLNNLKQSGVLYVNTHTPTPTNTATSTFTPTSTPTFTPNPTLTNTFTPTPTYTSTSTSTLTPTLTSTIIPIPTVFYVSVNGNDFNSGSFDSPWRTIQKAANTLIAGNTVYIRSGIYNEKITPLNSGNINNYINYLVYPNENVMIDGTNIILTSTDVRGDGLINIAGKSYLKFSGLTIRNSLKTCIRVDRNIVNSHNDYSNNIVLSNLNIQNCSQVGIFANYTNGLLVQNNIIDKVDYSSGIGVWNSDKAMIDNNKITNAHYFHECQGAYDEALTISNDVNFIVKNNSIDAVLPNPAGFCTYGDKLGIDIKESSQNGLVYKNSINHMSSPGIYVDGWNAGANGTLSLNHIDIYQNTLNNSVGITIADEQSDGIVEYINIYNNLILNSRFAGISINNGSGNGLRKNIRIYNNTIYLALPVGGQGGAGIYVTTENLGSNNSDKPVIIKNNISNFYFANGTAYVGQIRAGNSTMANMIDANNNIVFGPMTCSTTFTKCVEVGSRITKDADDLFINSLGSDLHLKGGSIAINAGVDMGLGFDFDGLNRMIPIDIGAYEFHP